MMCCDTCPYVVTCEELGDADDWGEEYVLHFPLPPGMALADDE